MLDSADIDRIHRDYLEGPARRRREEQARLEAEAREEALREYQQERKATAAELAELRGIMNEQAEQRRAAERAKEADREERHAVAARIGGVMLRALADGRCDRLDQLCEAAETVDAELGKDVGNLRFMLEHGWETNPEFLRSVMSPSSPEKLEPDGTGEGEGGSAFESD